MPRYRIWRSFGYAGTYSEDIIEADDLEEAEEMAQDFAFERVEYGAELLRDETE